MVSVLCTSSDDPLYLYKVSQIYLKRFLSYCTDTKSWRTERQTDRWIDIQMDGQGDYYRALLTSSGRALIRRRDNFPLYDTSNVRIKRLKFDWPYFVIVSVRVRNVIETIILHNQLVAVAREFPVLLAQSGYISEFIVHGIGPIPENTIISDMLNKSSGVSHAP